MAEAGTRVGAGFKPAPAWARPVMLVRIAIIVAILVLWEAIARSGLRYRDVVPSLVAIGEAMWRMYAMLIVLFVLAIAANALGGLGGLGSMRQR
jgi:NitT/TauT family transport system permease protein